MLALGSLIAAGSFMSLAAAQRSMTVINSCDETIWPAMYTDTNVSPSLPDQATGWEMAAGTTHEFTVPRQWNGRIWGRRDCDFNSGLPDPQTCATGACNGGLVCDQEGGTGVPPTTLAEWTLDSPQGDWYDVSLVDGFSVTMSIRNSGDCAEPSCTTNINDNCPEELQLLDDAGNVIACQTACTANLDGTPANSQNCCSGDFDTPETCPPSGVQYYDVFKNACPNAYAYAYDEGSEETVLFRCDAGQQVDWTVEFCPTPSTGTAKRWVASGWGSRALA